MMTSVLTAVVSTLIILDLMFESATNALLDVDVKQQYFNNSNMTLQRFS